MNDEKCNHDLESPTTTVRIIKRRFMVHPEEIHGVCTVCHKEIIFKKKNDLCSKGGQDNENV